MQEINHENLESIEIIADTDIAKENISHDHPEITVKKSLPQHRINRFEIS